MKKSLILAALSLMVLTFTGCFNFGAIEDESTPNALVEESEVIEVEGEKDEVVMDEVEDVEEIKYFGTLEDVTGGNASGEVSTLLVEGRYLLHAVFENLPELKNDFFYEGWIVRSSPLSVKSTGRTYVGTDGVIANEFMSGTDYTDHDLYVLTLEFNDGDPAPADHILEGKLVIQNNL